MFNKRLLPLAISSLFALTVVANASNPVRTIRQTNDPRCVLGQRLHRSTPDYIGQSVIGGIQDTGSIPVVTATQMRIPMSRNAAVALQSGAWMIAALEMAGNPASDSTPSSCYPPLSFTTTSIPSGRVGNAYTATLTANGGQPPYSWSFGRSSLPSGFAIDSNGDLTGTPTAKGNFSFYVVVSDSLKNNVTGELTLTVDDGTQPPPTQPPPTQPPPTTAPVIKSFSASPSSISAGGSSVLSWTVSGSEVTVKLNGAKATSPTTVSPSATTAYTLSASNRGGTATQTITVTVTQAPPTQPPPTQPPPTQPPPTQPPPTQPPPAAPVIQSFSASPSSISAGGNSVLSWTVSGSSVTIKLNGAAATSPDTVSPAATTSYTLSASNSGGTATQTVTVTVTQPSSGGGTPTGTALTACGPITKSGTYYLANDVSSAGTCFPLGANSVTLNLNSHTITYGTGGGSAPTPAISACSSWYTGLAASQCLGGGANLTVYGGTITQSASAAPFSPVFWMGQGDGSGGGSIHDLTATFQSVGSQFFHGEIDGGGYTIQNNVINDNVTNIQQPGQSPLSARAAFQGYVIHTDEEGTGTPPPDTISGNTFNGSPQGGVADGVANSQIYSNTIKLTSSYSNDYGVLVTMNGQNVHDNTITGRGRGLDAESSGFILNHNTVNVAEEANNSEYNGCELSGTYGIRVKNYDWPNSTESGVSASTNFQITNNSITTPATACQATAMDLTDMNSNVTGTISGNTFSAPAGSGGLADALGFEASNNANITFSNNSFTAPTCILIGSEGDISFGPITVQSGQTWSCSAGPTVSAQDYSYGQTGFNPPVLTIQDSIPNPTVSCTSYSTAEVKIGSSFSYTCSEKGN